MGSNEPPSDKTESRISRRFWLAAAGLLACDFAACDFSGKPGGLDSGGYYLRRGVVWYLQNWTSDAFIVQGVDIATFQFPLQGSDKEFARDKNYIYWEGRPISGLDPATFQHLEGAYLRDAKNIFFNDVPICDDAPHFEDLGGRFVKNSHAVYRLDLNLPPEERIVSTDAANFHQIAPKASGMFHADTHQLFVGGTLMQGVDPAKFHLLGGSYWRDDQQSYDWTDRMPDGTDLATLEAMEGGQYARDRGRVYYGAKVLADADPASFVITDPNWPKGKDAHNAYEQGNVLPPP